MHWAPAWAPATQSHAQVPPSSPLVHRLSPHWAAQSAGQLSGLSSLLHKPSRAKINVPVDYFGFTIEDRFVVGYGLDHAETYRNLPYIGVLSV